TVALVVVVVGLQFGLPVYRQHVANRDIERLGGTVETRPGGPKWLRYGVGNEPMKLFDQVIAVNLANRHVTDAILIDIGRLTSLQKLRLANTPVTDQGLAHLRRLTGLEQLSLTGTRVTDAGMVHVNGLTSLQEFSLDNTEVTDAGLVYLTGHTALEGLSLESTRVADRG